MNVHCCTCVAFVLVVNSGGFAGVFSIDVFNCVCSAALVSRGSAPAYEESAVLDLYEQPRDSPSYRCLIT